MATAIATPTKMATAVTAKANKTQCLKKSTLTFISIKPTAEFSQNHVLFKRIEISSNS